MIPPAITVYMPEEFVCDTTGQIEVIKCLRWLGGLGLKEAKDLSEIPGKPHLINIKTDILSSMPFRAWTFQGVYDGNTAEDAYKFCIQTLRYRGVFSVEHTIPDTVPSPVRKLNEDLKNLIVESMNQKQYDMSIQLIQVLRNFD